MKNLLSFLNPSKKSSEPKPSVQTIREIESRAEDRKESILTTMSKEARIRSAYSEWCKKYNKRPDETRFATFSLNYLFMEDYARENNKEMILNRFADCTEDEYISIMSGSVNVPNKAEESLSSTTKAMKVTVELKAEEQSGM